MAAISRLNLRAVQRVEVDARRAALQQILALRRGVADADLVHRGGVPLDGLQLGEQVLGDAVAVERGHALDPLHVGDGHDAGDDRHPDAHLAGALHVAEVVGVVEEELGHQELAAGFDFGAGVLQLALPVGGFGVHLRMGRAAHAEVEGAREGGEIGGVGEGALGARDVFGPQIAAQGDDVFDPADVQRLEDTAHLLSRVARRHHVGHRLDVHLLLDARHQREGERATLHCERTGHRDEVGQETRQLADRLEQLLRRPQVGRGKELEGEGRSVSLVQRRNAHAYLP
jgi:hypothetical protein